MASTDNNASINNDVTIYYDASDEDNDGNDDNDEDLVLPEVNAVFITSYSHPLPVPIPISIQWELLQEEEHRFSLT